jgi:hypothetical protein
MSLTLRAATIDDRAGMAQDSLVFGLVIRDTDV